MEVCAREHQPLSGHEHLTIIMMMKIKIIMMMIMTWPEMEIGASTCSIVSRECMWCPEAILISIIKVTIVCSRGVVTWHGPVVHGDGVHDHHSVVRSVLDHVDVAHKVRLEPADLRPVLHRASVSVRIELYNVTMQCIVTLPVENKVWPHGLGVVNLVIHERVGGAHFTSPVGGGLNIADT